MASRFARTSLVFAPLLWLALGEPVLGATAEPGVSPAPTSLTSLVTVGVGLIAVLAIIFGCAWVVRRMNGLTGVNNQAMKVVAAMALGARERIALIDVGGTQILVGITPSAIRTLHVFEEPVVTPGEGANSDFARRLQGMIGRSWKPGAGSTSDRPGGGTA